MQHQWVHVPVRVLGVGSRHHQRCVGVRPMTLRRSDITVITVCVLVVALVLVFSAKREERIEACRELRQAHSAPGDPYRKYVSEVCS